MKWSLQRSATSFNMFRTTNICLTISVLDADSRTSLISPIRSLAKFHRSFVLVSHPGHLIFVNSSNRTETSQSVLPHRNAFRFLERKIRHCVKNNLQWHQHCKSCMVRWWQYNLNDDVSNINTTQSTLEPTISENEPENKATGIKTQFDKSPYGRSTRGTCHFQAFVKASFRANRSYVGEIKLLFSWISLYPAIVLTSHTGFTIAKVKTWTNAANREVRWWNSG